MFKLGDIVKISDKSLLMQESSIFSKYKGAIGIISDKRDIKNLVKFVDNKQCNPRWFYNNELILIKKLITNEKSSADRNIRFLIHLYTKK